MLRCPPDLSISRPPLAPVPGRQDCGACALQSRSRAVSRASLTALMPVPGRRRAAGTVTNLFHTGKHLFKKKTKTHTHIPMGDRTRLERPGPPALSGATRQELPPKLHPPLPVQGHSCASSACRCQDLQVACHKLNTCFIKSLRTQNNTSSFILKKKIR